MQAKQKASPFITLRQICFFGRDPGSFVARQSLGPPASLKHSPVGFIASKK